MTGIKVYNAVFAALFATWIALFVIPVIGADRWSDKDMRAACAKHGGVRAFEANSILTAANQSKTVVICIDGYVTKDQP